MLLVERRAVALHRREILDRVWADVVVSDGALSQAVRTLRRALGDDGGVLEETRDVAGAERLYRDGLEMRRKLPGPEHPDVTRSRYALAGLLQQHGNPAEALVQCREVLALRGRTLPDAHPMVAACQQVAGLSLVALDRAREAEPLLRESLALRRRALPPGHWLVASSQSVLGACLTGVGRYREAEALLLEAHAGLVASLGEPHERTVEAGRRLAALYEAWDRESPARAWRR